MQITLKNNIIIGYRYISTTSKINIKTFGFDEKNCIEIDADPRRIKLGRSTYINGVLDYKDTLQTHK